MVAIISIIVNAITIPIGLYLLNPSSGADGKKNSNLSALISAAKEPVVWAPVLATILVLVGVKIPAAWDPTFNLIAKANSGVAVFAAGLDTLVATAGIIRHCPIDEMTEAQWQDVVDINLTGVFHAVKSVVPSMKERKYGHIVVISSIGGRTGRPGVGVNYAATKAGVNGLVMCLGYELGPWQITVNSVAPGPLKGKMFAGMTQDRIESLSAGIRLQRMGELSDVAAAIAYLGSDDAAWTTGEVLDVNGGLQY